ncbi:MAG: thiamine phosphate synthase [Oscillospiraceae bacterium]|nr:thiamine phosphate synthase [Oscillospiraceae bacterium]
MKPDIDYTLYLITDRELMSSATIEESVEAAIRGGCTLVQLREKTVSSREFYETAQRVRAVTTQLGVPLIINDRVDIALAVGADGVHVGRNDIPVGVVRRIVGPDRIVGVSASNAAEAQAAVDAGADYLGVGAMFVTGTKSDAVITTMEELRNILEMVELPIVVIGGINRETVLRFHGIGVAGVAVVSAIVAQADVAGAARELKTLLLEGSAGA